MFKNTRSVELGGVLFVVLLVDPVLVVLLVLCSGVLLVLVLCSGVLLVLVLCWCSGALLERVPTLI